MQTDMRVFYQQFCYANSEWYESLDGYYRPSDELLGIARAVIPPTWRLWRDGCWFHIHPAGIELPTQGWKIHISAIPANCTEVLQRAVSICLEESMPLKFLLDRQILSLAISKSWSREASGKFITIYPLSKQQFVEAIEALYTALQGFVGPYILSDNRYKDEGVVYYRYGGINGLKSLSFRGDWQYMLESPDGDLYPDWRTPYWNPPPWVSDPFVSDDSEEDGLILKDGRYHIERALNFSVTGGVYVGTDWDTGVNVVIKEARPATSVDENGIDAINRMQKEYRLLQKLQDIGITPRPVDLFWEWEHLFLVEEYIPGLDLGHFTIGFNPLMRVSPDKKTIQDYVEKLRRIWINLALGIAAMHSRGIVCGDLSIKNVLVKNTELGDVRVVDLEASWEEDVDAPTQLATPGFTSPTRRKAPSKTDDIYSLGAVLMGTLFPMNSLTEASPSSKTTIIEAMGGDLGLPKQIRQVIRKCMDSNSPKRPSPNQVAEVVRRCFGQSTPTPVCSPMSREDLLKLVKGAMEYIRASADLGREDRLFPADPFVFVTNPLSVAYGAAGVAYALHRIAGEVPKPIVAWILSRPVDPQSYPPGLYVGLAGIAWTLWELGLEEYALKILHLAHDHPLLWDAADIYYGASGYGLACLHFYLSTKDQSWLDQAVQVGEWLLHSKTEANNGSCYWSDKEGQAWLGYARGASGIALYLLYLSLITGDQRFLDTGKFALTFDLTHAHATEEGHLSIPRGTVDSFEKVLTHYWFDGSAGVATALLRYWVHTRNAEYADVLKRLAPDASRKYTVFPCLFRGLSGLGNFLLDAYELTGEEHYLSETNRVASGVALFAIQKPEGVAFPGEQLLRISTDFGTGSAGITLFLHRLVNADQRVGNFNFVLDQLLQQCQASDVPEIHNQSALLALK